MKIVLISDTHGSHEGLTVPSGDLLIHAGDMTRSGALGELEAFAGWLRTLPHPHKLLIAGNHDFCCERQPEASRAVLAEFTYLLDEAVAIEGIRFYGSPWTPLFFDWAFQQPRGPKLGAIWSRIPAGTEVLITHGPPQGILDWTVSGDRAGCEALAAVVVKVAPRYHIFGHIHEAVGQEQHGATMYINASSVDLEYRPVNPPVVIEI
jgi:predicted phosphodiesterase